MQLANEIMKTAKGKKSKDNIHVLDRQYQGLGMQEMTALKATSKEFKEIEVYLKQTQGATHGYSYKVEDIFRIERTGEDSRFQGSKFSDLGDKSDRRLLWHGSRVTNFGGILSQGLRIAPPEAPVSGYMFGKGVYLADMSSKSAGYCASYNTNGTGLLLLCEAELGTPPLKLTDSDYEAGKRAKSEGCISTWGVGQTAPAEWKDAGAIHASLKGVNMPSVSKTPPGPTNEDNAYLLYNEYIVYDISQIKLKYLLRVKM
jgi:poly [ADP-ribose] polymerase